MEESKREEYVEEFSMDEEAMGKLLTAAKFTRKGESTIAEIEGKRWHIRPTSNAQNTLMADMDFDVMYWQRQLKEADTAKQAKRLNRRIRKTYAKKAAHKVLGKILRWVPGLYALMWRRIYHSSEAVSATINATEAISENKVFYLANLGSSKQALMLCMTQVGESVKQRMERTESAKAMIAEDASQTKEDNK